MVAEAIGFAAESQSVSTGLDGAYTLELTPGTWHLHAETSAYQLMWYAGQPNPRTASLIQVEAGKLFEADFFLEPNPAGLIQGQVQSADGSPVDRALIMAAYPPDNPGEEPRLVWSAFSNSDGRFRLSVPPGAWYLAAAPDWRSDQLHWWGGDGTLENADRVGVQDHRPTEVEILLAP